MSGYLHIPGEQRRAPELSRAAPPDPRLSEAAVDVAKLELVGDLDEFGGWLGGHLSLMYAVDSERAARFPGRLANSGVPIQMHAALVAVLRKDSQGLMDAMAPMVEAYFKAQESRMIQIASEVQV